MATNTRLAGHELQSEGAPYRPGGRRGTHTRNTDLGRWTTGGIGYGLCSCGAKSEELESATKRKAWHREHKQQIREAVA